MSEEIGCLENSNLPIIPEEDKPKKTNPSDVVHFTDELIAQGLMSPMNFFTASMLFQSIGRKRIAAPDDEVNVYWHMEYGGEFEVFQGASNREFLSVCAEYKGRRYLLVSIQIRELGTLLNSEFWLKAEQVLQAIKLKKDLISLENVILQNSEKHFTIQREPGKPRFAYRNGFEEYIRMLFDPRGFLTHENKELLDGKR